jgi:alcohol dehydrogenase class IV
MQVKTAISSPMLRPSLALVDPTTTYSLPRNVIASVGFDILVHAIESYTAKPYSMRKRIPPGAPRPVVQGANPWSDMGCESSMRKLAACMVRAINDPADHAARDEMMLAVTLSGVTFNSAGVHVPHAMAYPIAGMVRDFRPAGYPQEEPMVPHGMSVVVNAPAGFRLTAPACPERHFYAAECCGADVRGATAQDSGEILARHLADLMRATGMPNGISALGYGADDIDALAAGALAQQRILSNAPCDVGERDLKDLFRAALRYWED